MILVLFVVAVGLFIVFTFGGNGSCNNGQSNNTDKRYDIWKEMNTNKMYRDIDEINRKMK